jgi:hypothetical protein
VEQGERGVIPVSHSTRCRPLDALARTQGLYFLATGVWPILSIRTFQRVTGPKVDRWLVRTVGVLVSIIGVVLLRRIRNLDDDTLLLAAGSAASLGAIDVVYATKKRIAPVYFLDAIVELAFIAGWMWGRFRTTPTG